MQIFDADWVMKFGEKQNIMKLNRYFSDKAFVNILRTMKENN